MDPLFPKMSLSYSFILLLHEMLGPGSLHSDCHYNNIANFTPFLHILRKWESLKKLLTVRCILSFQSHTKINFSILYISNLCPQLCCEPVNWFRQWTRAAQLSMHNKHASFSSSTYTPFQFGSPFNCTNFPSAFLPVNTCAALQCCSLFFEPQHQTSTHLQTSMGVSRYFLITPQYFCAKVCEEWWGWSPDHKLK